MDKIKIKVPEATQGVHNKVDILLLMPLYQLFCLRNVCQYSSSSYKGLLDASKNETKKLEFVIKSENFSLIDNSYNRVNEPGKILISIGGRQPDSKSMSDKSVLQSEIEITGNTFKIEE